MEVAEFHLPPQQFCPVCGAGICPEGRSSFECPHCGKSLVVAESQAYRWTRLLCTYAIAAIWAWSRWESSFIVFVVSFYAFPVMIVWRLIERNLRSVFPPKYSVPARSHFQTLGI